MAMTSPFAQRKWKNQNLILYHGTIDTYVNSIVNGGVDISWGRARTDFGRGFYTTTVLRQARSWAWQLTVRNQGTNPAVIRFDVNRDDLADLQALWFVRGNFDADDFWSLIFHCRGGGHGHHRSIKSVFYDLVVGPVAASWWTRLAFHDSDQISFHTITAQGVLNNCPRREVK